MMVTSFVCKQSHRRERKDYQTSKIVNVCHGRTTKKKRKKKQYDDIIWVHDNIDANERSDTERYIKTVVEARKIGDEEVLLAVAWTTKEGRLNHMKYPGVLGVDVTFLKNSNKKRPQMRVIGKIPGTGTYLLLMHFCRPNNSMSSGGSSRTRCRSCSTTMHSPALNSS